MKLYESGENYLEAILMLHNRLGLVRSIDIANELSYTKPSVSHAVGLLKEQSYIVVDPQGYITLTESGYDVAARIYERHQLLSKWLIALGVDEENATRDACRIEHDISDVSFQRIKEHVSKHMEG